MPLKDVYKGIDLCGFFAGPVVKEFIFGLWSVKRQEKVKEIFIPFPSLCF